ncbi:dephospho-CoA kinase [Caedibacter taeniospiralis]|uniref:dephospho-CoA kinase n=1 Tax=Caedibacter taeniospiralis TaxID=28907 RepID=UPI000C27F79C|nr:dephospho-CoA kinase [Caedibacter taeniospiralis]
MLARKKSSVYQNMYPVALTGGIGSGKTTVVEIFKTQHGIDVICADQCAKEVILLPEVISAIVNQFGAPILDDGGLIDRQKLRYIISQDSSARHWLNKLMHPIIRQQIEEKLKQSHSIYTIIDIPLLTQESLANYPYLKKIICVCALLERKLARIIQRDKQTKDEALALIQSQISDDERRGFSDFVIDNNGDIKALVPQITQIDLKIRKGI